MFGFRQTGVHAKQKSNTDTILYHQMIMELFPVSPSELCFHIIVFVSFEHGKLLAVILFAKQTKWVFFGVQQIMRHSTWCWTNSIFNQVQSSGFVDVFSWQEFQIKFAWLPFTGLTCLCQIDKLSTSHMVQGFQRSVHFIQLT